jgi:fatty acid desaturase
MTTMSTDAPQPDPRELRRVGLLVLALGLGLAAIIVTFTLITRQWWMLAFLLLVVPNVYVSLRNLRASRG